MRREMKGCTLCHAGIYQDELVAFSARRDGRMFVVEDVPALVCQTCGDQIFTEKAVTGVEVAIQSEPAGSWPIYRFPDSGGPGERR